jgi:hypothetical protein
MRRTRTGSSIIGEQLRGVLHEPISAVFEGKRYPCALPCRRKYRSRAPAAVDRKPPTFAKHFSVASAQASARIFDLIIWDCGMASGSGSFPHFCKTADQEEDGKMGKRFVPVRDADKRALDLYFALREVENMPLVVLQVAPDNKRPIWIGARDDHQDWWPMTVDGFLMLDVAAAKAKGGTARNLVTSLKKPARPRLPQAEIDRGVEQFFSGDDSE